MDIEKTIEEIHPTMPFPEKLKLKFEVQSHISMLSRHDHIRCMTIINILKKLYVDPVEQYSQ